MIYTIDTPNKNCNDLNEEFSRNWILHYNSLLSICSTMEDWEKESIEDLIRFNKLFDV